MQMLTRFDRGSVVAIFPERTLSHLALIVFLRRSARRELDAPRDDTFARVLHQQMHVVRHQHVGVDCALFAQRDLVEVVQVATVVVRREEARLAIVAALDHVLRDTGQVESGQAGHRDTP